MASATPAQQQQPALAVADSSELIRNNAKEAPGTPDSPNQQSESGDKRDPEYPDWDHDPQNPYNWPSWKKAYIIIMSSATSFVSSAGTSIISPATEEIKEHFQVSPTVALLPLALYIFALGFGPLLGGPLSETAGRMPIYWVLFPLGAIFTLGAGFADNFVALCILRFAAGFCYAPTLAVGAGIVTDVFLPQSRGPVMAIWILMPFLGPGIAPVIGAYASNRQGWRWTQWTMLFFSLFCIGLIVFTRECFHPIIKRRLAKQRGQEVPPSPPLLARLRQFAVVGLVRPLDMMVAEPISTFTCLYVAVNFGVLFSLFAAVPFIFKMVYNFGVENSGLVFLSVAAGCFIGLATIMFCNKVLYLGQKGNFPPNKIPPEYRLYPAMFGSIGLPIGLFWFAWTARSDISWASPVFAIVPFAWGNLCVFVSMVQYNADTYHGSVVASQAAANSMARYTFAGAFPLFVIQMYKGLTIPWAASLLGFVTIALLPIPWVLFKYGARIRKHSRYETVNYD
ncbi:hypothetical protein VHEMI00869 [[Torrubiella] hemipterigena]|nr:hypothetical protein VHEMI00869 [[Torrubiella] hemipterigena]